MAGKIVAVNVSQIDESTSKGVARGHEITVDRPPQQDGSDNGPMGGEVFLIGLGGCFMSNLLAAAKARGADVSNVAVEVAGTIDGSPGRFTAITLTVSANYDDPYLIEKLVTIARRGCLVVNSIKDAIDLDFVIV